MQYSNTTHPLIGFSTGALALGDWRTGLQRCRDLGLRCVELSALRFPEYQPLVDAVSKMDLSDFDYVSVHVPSRYAPEEEGAVMRASELIAQREWPMILHPDTVTDWRGWRHFGRLVCVENMDKRKPVGRTVEELEECFTQLPEAQFCFDYGHARQVDPTMSQARRLLAAFGDRLHQIHFSEVDASNRHRLLNRSALTAFAQIREPHHANVPVILEMLVTDGGAELQIGMAREFFSAATEIASALV